MKTLIIKLTLLLLASIALGACDHPENLKLPTTVAIATAVGHPERPDADVSRDKIRNPDTVLNFFDVKPGESIVELLAANGYYSELLSHCVGTSGKVYMQNNRQFYDFQTDKLVIERLANNRLGNVIRWDKELTDLELPENGVDKFLMILVLHDFYWMEQDVDLVIQEVYKTLKPGGILGIIDHIAEAGTGNQHALDVNGIHRIDKDFVINTMIKNGFVLDAESDALRQPQDNHNKAFYSLELKGKPTDRFMLRFKKPEHS